MFTARSTFMSSLIKDFQRDIVQSSKGTTELLRTAKLISVKLGLTDITEWISYELTGYTDQSIIPDYRTVISGELRVLNPYRGWLPVSQITGKYKIAQSTPELEVLASSKSVVIPLPNSGKKRLTNEMGMDVTDWQQQIEISILYIKAILSAVHDKLLDWSLELEKRGITGENMSFNPEEKQSAQNQNFHIQQFTGVLGNVTNSSVDVYNYSSLHQAIKDAGIPKDQRNELEDIMDQLKEANPDAKKSLLEKAKQWIIKNQDVLGATASVVWKALGINESV